MTHFILASLSPRRRELLQLCGYPFDIITVPVDENSVTDPDPIQNCVQTAQLKAKSLSDDLMVFPKPQSIIIAADTIVSVDGQMLGKPGGTAEALHMLMLLRGRSHQVHTGVSVIDLGIET